jgi:argininosuccinate lyase
VTLTGRIDGVPSEVWHDEVLAPQFDYEATHLLPWYLAIEKALLLGYRSMRLAEQREVEAVARRLHEITPELVRADPRENLSDIAFAIERHVSSMSPPPFAAWHADRSRNDLQATAQAMAGRDRLLAAVAALLRLGRAVGALAGRYLDTPMPGYTHLQAAQVISPGFYLSALGAETLRTLHRLRLSYTEVDRCPLGAGAMAGQELDWDRNAMAAFLGFAEPTPHALVAVASRGWALSVAGDLSGYGVTVSRFATDLMAWGSSGYGFIDLPDALSGISSAMPQKKNFPILERIRGRSAHLIGLGNDLAIAQRATPYANMVEVSKESSAHLATLFDTLQSTLRLFTTVLEHLEFRVDAMRAACERDYLGGFTLANLLTLRAGVPWRTAQVLAGRYIVAAMERGLTPAQPDGELLAALATVTGHDVERAEELLAEAFALDGALRVKRSTGSTNPDSVRDLLAAQEAEYQEFESWYDNRRAAIAAALTRIDLELSLSPY